MPNRLSAQSLIPIYQTYHQNSGAEKLTRKVEDILERYQGGERSFVESELDDAVYDFRGVVLEGADFAGSFITADFRGANLRGVNFSDCNVKTCDFRNADLSGASFARSALCSTEFTGAILDGACFAGAFAHSYVLKENEKPFW